MYTFLQNTFQSEHILNNYPAPVLGKIYQSIYQNHLPTKIYWQPVMESLGER